jgi:organic radical activating enzyme
MKKYKVKEIHERTVQGEGANAGLPITLVRFAGCNIWSGREQDREKAANKGMCALWCDTDFRGTDGNKGGSYSRAELVDAIKMSFDKPQPSVKGNSLSKGAVMFTGGEPTLQLDYELLVELMEWDIDVLIETNGTQKIDFAYKAANAASLFGGGNLWVTISPKPPAPISEFFATHRFDELKLVYDKQNVDPQDYVDLYATHRYLQPLDSHDVEINCDNVKHTLLYVAENPLWRMGLQSHKIWNAP